MVRLLILVGFVFLELGTSLKAGQLGNMRRLVETCVRSKAHGNLVYVDPTSGEAQTLQMSTKDWSSVLVEGVVVRGGLPIPATRGFLFNPSNTQKIDAARKQAQIQLYVSALRKMLDQLAPARGELLADNLRPDFSDQISKFLRSFADHIYKPNEEGGSEFFPALRGNESPGELLSLIHLYAPPAVFNEIMLDLKHLQEEVRLHISHALDTERTTAKSNELAEAYFAFDTAVRGYRTPQLMLRQY